MCHLANKLFTIRNIIDIELVGSFFKLLIVILDELFTCQGSLSFSLIDIFKLEVGEELRDDRVIFQNGDAEFSVIKVCHTNSYIIFRSIHRDTRQRILGVLFDRVLIIHITVSVAICLVHNIRVDIDCVYAILFDDLCRILVFAFPFIKEIVDLREYDITFIYIIFSVLGRDNGIVCVIQLRFKCEFFYSEFSAFDGLLGTKHQVSFSIVLVTDICKIDIVVASGHSLTVDLDLYIESFRLIIARDFDFNCMFGRIISNAVLIALDFCNRVVEGLLIAGNIAITVFDRIKVLCLELDLAEPGLAVCIIFHCDRTRRSRIGITCCCTCRSAVFSCQSKLIISGCNFHIASAQALKRAKFYCSLIRLVLHANSCRRQVNPTVGVSCLTGQTVCKSYLHDVINQIISGRSYNFFQCPYLILVSIDMTCMRTGGIRIGIFLDYTNTVCISCIGSQAVLPCFRISNAAIQFELRTRQSHIALDTISFAQFDIIYCRIAKARRLELGIGLDPLVVHLE